LLEGDAQSGADLLADGHHVDQLVHVPPLEHFQPVVRRVATSTSSSETSGPSRGTTQHTGNRSTSVTSKTAGSQSLGRNRARSSVIAGYVLVVPWQ